MSMLLKQWIAGMSSGTNWSSYWATLISATVENAAPTHVVLTFPAAQTSLGASDFTIAGFTVSSASWTGAVLTLVLSSPVTVFVGDLTITFVKTGTTATVTNNVAMANTVGWYAAGDGSATYVTKDGSDFVSVWKDLSGANHPLNQATGTNQPKWEADGVLFDGVDNFIQSATFTFNKPGFLYIVFKQITWTNGDRFTDGEAADSFSLGQLGVTPQIFFTSGSGGVSASVGGLALNTFAIVRVLDHLAASKLIINNEAPVTGTFGYNNYSGFVLGSKHNGAQPANIKIKEAIVRNSADDAATEAAIYAYLKNKYSL